MNFKQINAFYIISNQDKILLVGISQLDAHQKIVEVDDKEKSSFELFLGVRTSKIVELGKVIGIGGEGIVVEKELEIEIWEGRVEDRWSKKAGDIFLKSRQSSITAMKFVEFEAESNENFQGQGLKRYSEISSSKFEFKRIIPVTN